MNDRYIMQAQKRVRKAKGFVLLTLILWGVCLTGWVMNIVKLAYADLDPLTGFTVLRIIGVPLAPLGVVLGFL